MTAAAAEMDRRDKLQALSLAKDRYAMKLDSLSSTTVVDRAIQFIKNHRSQTLPRTLKYKSLSYL